MVTSTIISLNTTERMKEIFQKKERNILYTDTLKTFSISGNESFIRSTPQTKY